MEGGVRFLWSGEFAYVSPQGVVLVPSVGITDELVLG